MEYSYACPTCGGTKIALHRYIMEDWTVKKWNRDGQPSKMTTDAMEFNGFADNRDDCFLFPAKRFQCEECNEEFERPIPATAVTRNLHRMWKAKHP